MNPQSQLRLPITITGGCLCGSIRYTITFPKNAEWPPNSNTTCQCTQCRKFTGCLVPQNITIPTNYITPTLSSNATYKSFHSSPQAYRSFCSTCGSSIAFNEHATPDNTELFIGTFDEVNFCGEGAAVGEVLARAKNHIWMDNAVRGVTDQNLEGGLYRKDREEEWRIVK
jgi:hypothetical protein